MDTNYVNEQVDTGGDFPEQAYGSSKYRRLSDIKARYDPSNLFRLNANIAPTANPPLRRDSELGGYGFGGRGIP